MLSCQECERYLPVFLDHALEVKESLDVQAHLQSCPPCTDRAESERLLRTVVRQFLDVPPPPEEFKRAIILRAMQDEQSVRVAGLPACSHASARFRYGDGHSGDPGVGGLRGSP